eukprot:757447-Hanusia_phi.AAC.3
MTMSRAKFKYFDPVTSENLNAFSGEFGSIYRDYSIDPVIEEDVVRDSQNKIIYQKDESGNVLKDENGRPIPETVDFRSKQLAEPSGTLRKAMEDAVEAEKKAYAEAEAALSKAKALQNAALDSEKVADKFQDDLKLMEEQLSLRQLMMNAGQVQGDTSAVDFKNAKQQSQQAAKDAGAAASNAVLALANANKLLSTARKATMDRIEKTSAFLTSSYDAAVSGDCRWYAVALQKETDIVGNFADSLRNAPRAQAMASEVDVIAGRMDNMGLAGMPYGQIPLGMYQGSPYNPMGLVYEMPPGVPV